jgi:hypothetical protein
MRRVSCLNPAYVIPAYRVEVPKNTPFGRRVIDIEVSKDGKVLGGVETKTGNSRYTPAQQSKDEWLRMNGYPVDVVRKP